ncbi:MAG: hypothetical protein WBD02_07115 [Acidimicrobiia bacterium]
MNAAFRVDRVSSGEDWAAFGAFPFSVYEGDARWSPVQPEMTIQRLMQGSDRESSASWIARDGSRVVGRVSAMTDSIYSAKRGESTGFVGFFESLDHPDAAALLLARVDDWFREHEVVTAFGPSSLGLFEATGMLIEGFELPAVVGCAYNPPRYSECFESAGWLRDRALLGYSVPITGANEISERERSIGKRLLERLDLSLRLFTSNDTPDRLIDWFGAGDKNPWRHLELHWPLTRDEVNTFAKLAQTPGTGIHIGEIMLGNDVAVGVFVCQDDTNELMRELYAGVQHPTMTIVERLSNVRTVRSGAYGFLPEFQGVGLTAAIPLLLENLRSDYPKIEVLDLSWIDERNTPMVATAERFAGPPTRRWQLWSKRYEPNERSVL